MKLPDKEIIISPNYMKLEYRKCESTTAKCHTCWADITKGDFMLSVPSSQMNRAIICKECLSKLIELLKETL